MNEVVRNKGSCACGAVRLVAVGAPKRCGICHCRDCQRAHAAPYFAFAVFARGQVSLNGPTGHWAKPAFDRLFCTACGSRVAGLAGDGIEIPVCVFDAPDAFQIGYEIWTRRRCAWVSPLDVPQFVEGRPPA